MFFSDYISYEIGHQLDGITLDDILLFPFCNKKNQFHTIFLD